MLACLAPNGMNVFGGAAPPTHLLVGTIGGIAVFVRSPNGESSFPKIVLEGHHISSMVVEPGRGMIFAGVHGGTVYRSEDQGNAWTEASNGITINHVYTLACTSSRNESVLYAGTEPAGLFRSRDYGESWIELGSARDLPGREKWSFPMPPHVAHAKCINIDPQDPERLLLGVEQGGLYQSSDGGKTWEELSAYADPTDKVYKDIHQVVRRPSCLDEIAMTSGMGLYYSKDNGVTWVHLTDRDFRIGYPDKVIFMPDSDNRLIMCGAHRDPGSWIRLHTANPAVVVSPDLGSTWIDSTDGLPGDLKANIEALSMYAFTDGFVLFVGTTDGEIYARKNGVTDWHCMARNIPPISKVAHYRLLIPRTDR